MSPSALVLVCALDLLGRSADQFPPIRILPAPPPGASAGAQGFFDSSEGVIYLISSAPAFREADAAQRRAYKPSRCPARAALQMVASVIVHEEWHARHGSDERGAYYAQLTTLNQLGAGPGSSPYYSVTRAMHAVAQAQKAQPVQGARAAIDAAHPSGLAATGVLAYGHPGMIEDGITRHLPDPR